MSKVGRNDPCPCGSGRKYKHCCLNKDQLASAPPVPAAADSDAFDSEAPPFWQQDVPLDPRAAERNAWAVEQLLAGQHFKTDKQYAQLITGLMNTPQLPKIDPKTPVEEAQLMMYDAFAAEGKKRVEMAEKALEISPDCADAYVLLAEESVKSADEAVPLFNEGIAAGERALGPDFENRYSGQFWTKLETRPYLRARFGLARAYSVLGRHEEAVEECKVVLALDPLDNQGASYVLLNELIHAGQDQAALELAESFPEDFSTQWLLNSALVKFRIYGDGIFPRHALKLAMEVNPRLLPYLVGEKKLPKRPPKETEQLLEMVDATLYMAEMLPAWSETPGALEWAKQWLHDSAHQKGEEQIGKPTGPRIFLNPDPDFYDAHWCPECQEKTRKREDHVVLLIEPNYFCVSKLHGRFCERCNILTINAQDATAAAAGIIKELDPDALMRPYLPVGILNEADLAGQDVHHLDPTWTIEHMQGFRERISEATWEEMYEEIEDSPENPAISPLILPGRYR
jgi:tetratricopeptide (TPR) repeat protein